jgi:hypothetical protein
LLKTSTQTKILNGRTTDNVVLSVDLSLIVFVHADVFSKHFFLVLWVRPMMRLQYFIRGEVWVDPCRLSPVAGP